MVRKRKKPWHGLVVWAIIVLFFLGMYFLGRYWDAK